MHLYCIGAGEPTIVLESGLGASSDVLGWMTLQTKLARYSRVCSYDRAGMGWSESADTPRDADHIAADLHALLAKAGVRPPFVLVGLSRGGLYIRDYAAHYRGEVAGLVLVDSSTPYQEQRLHPNAGSREWAIAVLDAQYLLGLARLHGWCGHASPGPDRRYAEALAEDDCIAYWAGVREYLASPETDAEVALAPPPGALPVLIISRDPSRVLTRPSASRRRSRARTGVELDAGGSEGSLAAQPLHDYPTSRPLATSLFTHLAGGDSGVAVWRLPACGRAQCESPPVGLQAYRSVSRSRSHCATGRCYSDPHTVESGVLHLRAKAASPVECIRFSATCASVPAFRSTAGNAAKCGRASCPRCE